MGHNTTTRVVGGIRRMWEEGMRLLPRLTDLLEGFWEQMLGLLEDQSQGMSHLAHSASSIYKLTKLLAMAFFGDYWKGPVRGAMSSLH